MKTYGGFDIRNDHGAVAVIVALMITVLVLFAAIAVDLGYMFTVRRQLQTSADAAALAGARLLAENYGAGAIMAEAQLYAEDHNSANPGDGLWMVTDTPETEVGADYVQVTVAKNAPLFFGRILGDDATQIKAASRAKIAYLAGVGGLAPLSVPIVRATRVAVEVNGIEYDLNPQGSGLWTRTIPAPAARTDGYGVRVALYNSQTSASYPDGVPLYVEDNQYGRAGSMFVAPVGFPITDVSMDRYVVTQGETGKVTLQVRSVDEPSAEFNGKKNWKFTEVSSGVWQTKLDVPDGHPNSDPPVVLYPVTVGVGKQSVKDAAVLMVRRSTYPVLDFSLSDYNPDPAQWVEVSVLLNEFRINVPYTIHVAGGGGEIGNFSTLDLDTVRETIDGPYLYDPKKEDPDYTAPTWKHYLANPFPFVISIGNVVTTEPGSSMLPILTSLADRFDDEVTFEEWDLAGRPPSTRIVLVPVIENLEPFTGATNVRIVDLAAFYVEPYTLNGNNSAAKSGDLMGIFIEYVRPSDAISEDPSSEFAIRTVRLVPPQ